MLAGRHGARRGIASRVVTSHNVYYGKLKMELRRGWAQFVTAPWFSEPFRDSRNMHAQIPGTTAAGEIRHPPKIVRRLVAMGRRWRRRVTYHVVYEGNDAQGMAPPFYPGRSLMQSAGRPYATTTQIRANSISSQARICHSQRFAPTIGGILYLYTVCSELLQVSASRRSQQGFLCRCP